MEVAEVDRLVMKPTARRRLGKYVLLGRLGHGGMGKIYLAHAPGPAGIEKLLVVKRLHSHLTGDPVLVSSFLDEARLSMALNHPNIGHTFDVGEVDGRYFMVMEYIDGQNLGVVLRMAKRSGQYPKSSLWGGLFLSVLDGLHAAHTARDARGRPLQIIHRDVSPQNVIITYEGLPKLVDFGIAKAAMRVQETDAGTLKGKYAYMSPEQVRGEPLDARSDVFAAGIVLWEMLAGRRLYKAETIVRSVERILQEPLISPVRVNGECHPELAKICLKALQKDKNQRFSSADEFKDALEDAIAATGERFRPQMCRELMQRLFKDVIDKQRAVLEQCLNQTGDIPEDVDDEKSTHSDSQSDLKMPRLPMGASELASDSSTTPSAKQRSPLVTAEDDGAGALLAPPKETQKEKETLIDRDRKAVAPTASAPSSSPPAAVLAPPLSPAEDVVTEPPRQRSLVVPIAAALIGLCVAVAIVIAIDKLGGDDQTVAVVDAPPKIDPSTPREDPTPPTVITADAGVAAAAVVADAGVAVVADTSTTAGQLALNDDDDDDEPAPPGQPKKKKQKKSQKAPPPPPPPPPKEETKKEAVVVEGEGFLTLDTVPWTTVYLGKKKLGETPLIKVPVPAGNLELSLVNPEQNIKEAYFAKVKPGETFSKRLDLR